MAVYRYQCPACGDSFVITSWLSGSWIRYVRHLEIHLEAVTQPGPGLATQARDE